MYTGPTAMPFTAPSGPDTACCRPVTARLPPGAGLVEGRQVGEIGLVDLGPVDIGRKHGELAAAPGSGPVPDLAAFGESPAWPGYGRGGGIDVG